jgi:ABC-type transporter Mla MlaB component
MARIRMLSNTAPPLVVVTGRLTAADMGRLEQACSPALVSDPLWLEIDLRGVTHTDSTALAVLQRLVARGAVLTMFAAELC